MALTKRLLYPEAPFLGRGLGSPVQQQVLPGEQGSGKEVGLPQAWRSSDLWGTIGFFLPNSHLFATPIPTLCLAQDHLQPRRQTVSGACVPGPQCDFASQFTVALDTVKDFGDNYIVSDLKPSAPPWCLGLPYSRVHPFSKAI